MHQTTTLIDDEEFARSFHTGIAGVMPITGCHFLALCGCEYTPGAPARSFDSIHALIEEG